MLRWQQLHMHVIDPASASPFFKPTSENCAPQPGVPPPLKESLRRPFAFGVYKLRRLRKRLPGFASSSPT